MSKLKINLTKTALLVWLQGQKKKTVSGGALPNVFVQFVNSQVKPAVGRSPYRVVRAAADRVEIQGATKENRLMKPQSVKLPAWGVKFLDSVGALHASSKKSKLTAAEVADVLVPPKKAKAAPVQAIKGKAVDTVIVSGTKATLATAGAVAAKKAPVRGRKARA